MISPIRSSLHRSFLPALVAAAFVACSGSDPNDSSFPDNGPNSAGGNGSAGSEGANSSATSPKEATLTSGTGATEQPDAGCASESRQAKLTPLDMYIMLDATGSMLQNDKWGAVTKALTAFVKDGGSAGIGVALQYFSLPTNACDPNTYATPAVAMAELPGNSASIAASLAAHTPNGGTAMRPALEGAVQYAQSWGKSHPDHTVIVVLATDGEPNNCSSTVANVSQAASMGLGGTPKVATFVIGVGSSLGSLNAIAVAGGTSKALIVDEQTDTTKQFIDALNAIRVNALACEYAIPTPSGGPIDTERVNVTYTPGTGASRDFSRVDGKGQCSASVGEWYYDDAQAPKRIVLCDATCSALRADKAGRVDVVFGCKTRTAIPK